MGWDRGFAPAVRGRCVVRSPGPGHRGAVTGSAGANPFKIGHEIVILLIIDGIVSKTRTCFPTETSYVNVMLGHGDGTFESSSSGPYSGDFYSLALGDFNGDGKADVAVPGLVFPGNGDGTLRHPATSA